MRKKQRTGGRGGAGKASHFWNKEYKKNGGRDGHLALSTNPSEDLMKFCRWMTRETGAAFLNPTETVLDLGCGNGRNLFYLAETFGLRGIGFDISAEAVAQAKKLGAELPIEYATRSISDPLPLPDESATFVLDMMVSHYLNAAERAKLTEEIARVLKPGGYLFFKTFFLEDDRHAIRLLKENPGEEKGTYIHPEIGVAEHVFTEQEIKDMLTSHFEIKKISKSHGHLRHNAKRRSICVYAEKIQ